MFSTYICSVFSFQRKVIYKPTTTNMFGNKLFLWLCWIQTIFKRFIHTLCSSKTMLIYTNQTRSRLHPTEPFGISGFYALLYKITKKLKCKEEMRKQIAELEELNI